MHIRLSTLAENTASWLGLLAEWGLSILVEIDETAVLVDTGLSGVTAHNARIMGVNIEKIDKILFILHLQAQPQIRRIEETRGCIFEPDPGWRWCHR